MFVLEVLVIHPPNYQRLTFLNDYRNRLNCHESLKLTHQILLPASNQLPQLLLSKQPQFNGPRSCRYRNINYTAWMMYLNL